MQKRFTMRSDFIRQRAEDAVDFLDLLRLELAHAIAELDRGRRLDEEGGSRGRGVLDDSPDRGAGLAPNGNHIAAVAKRDRHVADALRGVEVLHRVLEQANQLAVGRAQLAPDAPQRWRRVVTYRGIVVENASDAVLERLRRVQAAHERREHGPRDGGAPPLPP